MRFHTLFVMTACFLERSGTVCWRQPRQQTSLLSLRIAVVISSEARNLAVRNPVIQKLHSP
jgi:hypothetical protein